MVGHDVPMHRYLPKSLDAGVLHRGIGNVRSIGIDHDNGAVLRLDREARMSEKGDSNLFPKGCESNSDADPEDESE